MTKIDISGWGEFELKKLFGDCKKGSRLVQAERIDGDVPLVTAGYENAGITSNIGNANMEVFKDCISIDMFGNCFYRDYEFNADDNVLIFAENIKNKYVSMYIAGVVGTATSGYDYINQYRINNYNRQEIKLPTTSSGDPDWQYMEDYMRNIEVRVSTSISKLESVQGVENSKIDVSSWGEFFISEVFETTKKGKSLQVPTGANVQKKDLEDGSTPRITVTGINNGIYDYYADIPNDNNYRVYENFISVSFLGTVFYQKGKASLDMKVHCLRPIKHTLNEYTGEFLITAILASLKESSYSDQISSTVLPSLTIKLPIDSQGNPDWIYMENYMKEIEIKVKGFLDKIA